MEVVFRKSCRALVTRLVNQTLELLNNEAIDENDIRIHIGKLKGANDNLRTANKDTYSVIQADSMEAECTTMAEYEEKVISAISVLEALIVEKRSSLALSMTAIDVNNHNPSVTPVTENRVNTMRQVKLPKLELKKFNGELKNWLSFWEQFRTAVHENASLDGITKYNYLQSVLEGKAASTISGLSPSASCYNEAIKMLKEEYGNNERIIDNYIQQLMSFQNIKSRNDVKALRKLYNATSAITRSLESMGTPVTEYGRVIKSIILRVLPYSMNLEFHRQHASGSNHSESREMLSKETLESLMTFIKKEVDSLELALTVYNNELSNGTERKPKGRTDHVSRNISTAAGLYAGVKEACLFCGSKMHDTTHCTKSITIQEKKNILKRSSRCFRCTKPNHLSKACKSQGVICETCHGRHLTIMCDPSYARKNERRPDTSQNKHSPESTVSLFTNGRLDKVLLQTGRAYASADGQNKTKEKAIRFILDGGSQLTFIKESVSKVLDLPIVSTHKLSILPFGSKEKSTAKLFNRVALCLRGQYNSEVIRIEAVAVPEICLEEFHVPCVHNLKLAGYKLADAPINDCETLDGISLLIGADFYWELVTGENERVSKKLTAVNTRIGWTLHGPAPIDCVNVNLSAATVTNLNCNIKEELDVRKFWDLETIGITNVRVRSTKFTEEFIQKNLTFEKNRYIVSLPWKNAVKSLDDNYVGASKRLKNLTVRLAKESQLARYDAAIRDQISEGVVEYAPPRKREQVTYYMPHRPVFREDKASTKMRIVYDASASAKGYPSLNDQLHSGDNLNPDLVDILMNFRIGNIGIIADVEKAFLQIILCDRDRDAHRFLWYNSEMTALDKFPVVQEFRMTRLTFGVTCSPFVLAATIKKHLMVNRKHYEFTSKVLEKSFYVDDLVAGVSTKQQAKQLYEESVQIMKSAGMNLRKWYTNDDEVRSEFGQQSDLDPIRLKVLGLRWMTKEDELAVDLQPVIEFVEGIVHGSKRSILQAIARIYDPLGLLGPFVIKLKILLQAAWKLKLPWDTLLSEELEKIWSIWCKDLKGMQDVSITRCVLNGTEENVHLHVFADASPHAYGAVAYLKVPGANPKLLCAKNRVAPIKGDSDSLTLPKLELTAALCAARLQHYVKNHLRITISETYLWSDSEITLHWLKKDSSKMKQYVMNRVNEIRELTADCKWRHCSGKENPADLLTRGVSAAVYLSSTIWFSGPSWLNEEGTFTRDQKLLGVSVFGNHNVSNVPTFEMNVPRNVTTAVGQTAFLHCTVHQLGDKEVSWMRKRDMHILSTGFLMYTSDLRFQVIHPDKSENWTLQIKSPQERDSGVYECQISTEPKMSLNYSLNVVEARARISGPSDIYVKTGSLLTLTCLMSQGPHDLGTVAWYRGSQPVVTSPRSENDIDSEPRITVETEWSDALTSRLRITHAKPSDSGNYSCVPTVAEKASVNVHVINGEHPAAMQHGNTAAGSPTSKTVLVMLAFFLGQLR